MKQRIVSKGISENKIVVIPPWAHDDLIRYDAKGRVAFREKHGLTGKYVVMYSGNHSPCHPLDTLLQAAHQLADHPEIVFCFIGGGSEFNKVKCFAGEHGLTNVVCLPYQPLDQLTSSLSAADLHVVVMGDRFAGIVHPCKIYNILVIGTPVLYIGPAEGPIGDIVKEIRGDGLARVARHGDVAAVARQIVEGARAAAERTDGDGNALASCFRKKTILPRLIEVVESPSVEKFKCQTA